MRKALFTITLALATLFATAQKFGHINTQAILEASPEYTQAELELKEYQASLQAQFKTLAELYSAKETEYLKLEQKCAENPDACDKDILEREYGYLMESADKLEAEQYDMQVKIQERQNYLIDKLIKKIKAAAELVAQEKGIVYVFDSGTLIYAGGEDLNDAVKVKLQEMSTTSGQ